MEEAKNRVRKKTRERVRNLENKQEEKHLQKLHECTSFDSMMVMRLPPGRCFTYSNISLTRSNRTVSER